MALDKAFFTGRLFSIYSEIDGAYRKSAEHYGFSCDGCEDNCCRTVFYHYTLVEYFGLLEGFDRLPAGIRDESMRKGRAYLEKLKENKDGEEGLDLMCPLNYDGLCRIYEYRPLICRIHGFPGRFDHPVKGDQRFTGCKVFNETCQEDWTQLIDRTPFYVRIADLEGRLRRRMNYKERFRKTIAGMLIERDLYDRS
ncbi:MAG: hypothetical protein GXO94_01010, partial [Nitrospirae bacterium]|nr:hypothetical protein [Nitrospirota bacterium]